MTRLFSTPLHLYVPAGQRTSFPAPTAPTLISTLSAPPDYLTTDKLCLRSNHCAAVPQTRHLNKMDSNFSEFISITYVPYDSRKTKSIKIILFFGTLSLLCYEPRWADSLSGKFSLLMSRCFLNIG